MPDFHLDGLCGTQTCMARPQPDALRPGLAVYPKQLSRLGRCGVREAVCVGRNAACYWAWLVAGHTGIFVLLAVTCASRVQMHFSASTPVHEESTPSTCVSWCKHAER